MIKYFFVSYPKVHVIFNESEYSTEYESLKLGWKAFASGVGRFYSGNFNDSYSEYILSLAITWILLQQGTEFGKWSPIWD